MFIPCPNCRASIDITEDDYSSQVGCNACGEIVSVPESRLAPGMVLGDDFIIESEIGSGGMATIYLAQQMSLQRQVALKVLHPEHASQAEEVKGFVREARSVAQLNHPGIVQIFSVGDDDGYYYFAMELVMGASVKEILAQEEKPALEWSLTVARKIALSLKHGWENGRLVHRDIKPDNIIIRGDGAVKLADLGLAKPAEALREFDEEVEGTPQYISPEGILGESMDFRSDIYSLGATLYHMATGEFPYDAESPFDTARLHVEGTLTPPSERAEDVPSYVDAVIMKMMAKKPEDRYQSLDGLISALGQAISKLRRLERSQTQAPTKTLKTGLSNTESSLKRLPTSGEGSDRLIRLILIGAAVVAVSAIGVVIYLATRFAIHEPPPNSALLPATDAGSTQAAGPDERRALMTMAGLVPGWRTEYFGDKDFGKLLGTGTSDEINFSSPPKSPLLKGRRENFSIRYTGQLFVPERGAYTFQCTADDGQRLWVDKQELIAEWDSKSLTTATATAVLSKGLHDIRYDYRQWGIDAVATVKWHAADEEPGLLTSLDVFCKPLSSLSVDLLMYWPFDRMQGQALPDQSGLANDAAPLPDTAAALVDDAMFGKALRFDRTDSEQAVGYTVDEELPDEAVSISFWLAVEQWPDEMAGRETRLIRWADSTVALKLTFDAAADVATLTFLVNGADASVPYRISADRWTHLVWIYEDAVGGRLVVDGVSLGTSVKSPTPLAPGRIGAFQFGSNALAFRMDELAVWLRSLSANEIDRLYNGGKPRVIH